MSSSTFPAAFALLIVSEGGFVDHPRDPGGATNLGVTQKTLSAYLGRPATVQEVRQLTPAKVAPIYKKNYWDKVRGDDLPAGLDYCVFDFAVNSGPTRAIMSLQRAVGVADDGSLGPITLEAVRRRPVAVVISAICDDRMVFLRKLSTWDTFGKGWTSRVAAVRGKSIGFARSAENTVAQEIDKIDPRPAAVPTPLADLPPAPAPTPLGEVGESPPTRAPLADPTPPAVVPGISPGVPPVVVPWYRRLLSALTGL